ncbi:HipA domain-containing protein [Petroclostridium sp. X23]|uniref:HipA domain-containing protein n=1 Tax=Petroclostridium sp. X23 TaxID=3045146 RepID=UPI0024AC88C0|nr:HipA domain-containing protein [Petroclostridium sp. X23]WHH59722.1 HipA domain-containing protein [Petroclostridium sp. X23]
MIDFTLCEVNKFRAYGGANGNKINILYEGSSYMLKFPPVPSRNKAMSYTNGCISEYLTCHIFAALGFKTQETLLGTYTDSRGKEKVVVACGDFTEGGKKLMEFAHLKNTCISSEQNGYGKELSSIQQAIDEQSLLPQDQLRDFFWDMFIADALLGNFDRHNGNWGILVDEQSKTAEIAPVYDCGSCLYPQLAVNDMEAVLNSEDELDKRIYVFPSSSIEENGKKIPYFEFISSLKNPDCTAALKRVSARIDMEKIQALIDETPSLLPIQKEFYTVMISERKAKILDYSMEQLMKLERQEPKQERLKNQGQQFSM